MIKFLNQIKDLLYKFFLKGKKMDNLEKINDVEEVKKHTMKDICYVKDYEKLRDIEFSTPYPPNHLFDFIILKEEVKNKLSELRKTLNALENIEKGGVEILPDDIKNYLDDEKFDLSFYMQKIIQESLTRKK